LLASVDRTLGAEAPASRVLLLDAAAVASDVVAVGEIGTVLRSPDSGRSWTSIPPATKATLTAVSFAPGSPLGWAVGHDALILATQDGGKTWSKAWQGENLEASFLDVCAVSVDHVIAVGAYGLYLTTSDGGKTWTSRQILDEDMHLNRISRGPTGTLYLAGERGTLLRSTDTAGTWTPIDSPYDGSFYGILPLGPETLLAYGLRGRLFRSTDDGASWVPVLLPSPALIATATRLADGTVVLAGQARAQFVSHDDGVTFAPWPLGFDHAIAELLVSPAGPLIAFGEAGAANLSDRAPAPSPAQTPLPSGGPR
jgi:photosystem II stability/assembly factor-like uncharacterized protein